MNNDWKLYAMIAGIGLTGIFSFVQIARHAGFVHDGLRAFRKSAEQAKSREELMEIRHRLCEFHDKYCYVRQLGDHAREVLAYINGRLAQ